MSPMQYDPNITSPINREELTALLRRERDIKTHEPTIVASERRADDVVVHRAAVAAWLGKRK